MPVEPHSLSSRLQDALEATSNDDQASSGGTPKSDIESIGACFEEMAEGQEFDSFLVFAKDIIGRENGPSPSQVRVVDRMS